MTVPCASAAEPANAACAERWGLPYNEKIAAEEKISAHKLTTIETHGERFSRRLCMNCLQPACASVCPVGALQKTALGPVVYDADKCIGCRYCMQACPFQVPSYEWNSRLPKMRKCDMCYERQSKGKPTACAEACPVGATISGERDDLVAEAHKRIADKPGRVLHQRSTACRKPAAPRCSIFQRCRSSRSGCAPTFRRKPCRRPPGVCSNWCRTSFPPARCCWAASGGSPTAAPKWPKRRAGNETRELARITIWSAIFAAIMVSGLYATFLRMFYGLGGSTNLSDQFPWGLWIAFDVMCGVGLAAGGFTLVAMVHIFNIEKYKPVLRPAILTAFLGYVLVVVGLLFDLGRPDRLWHPLVMWNPHSVMFEVAWCVTLYTTVLFLEFLPMVFEKFGWHQALEMDSHAFPCR